MIEFYNKNFTTNYKAKINQLKIDLRRLLEIENIGIIKENKIVLNPNFKRNLDSNSWTEINDLYNTLSKNKDKISNTLLKFINKTKTNKRSKFKFIDTFAGCGGLSLGLKSSGFDPVLINEIEPKFLESYYFNHDISLENYYCCDINHIARCDVIKNKHTGIDLIVGGPPCQGFSIANRQRIIDDPRNKLYKHFLELLGNLKPKFFVMENVKGMMNKAKEILDDFHSSLGTDYNISITLLNAKDFGIPQNRERVFVIGSKVKGVSADKIIKDIISLKTSIEPKFLKDALFGLPKLQPKEQKNKRGLENDKIGFKFRKNLYSNNEFINKINKNKKVFYLSNHINRFNNKRDIEIFKRLPQGANSLHSSIKDIMPYSSRNHMFKDKYYKLIESEVSKTITSHMKLDCNMYIHPSQARGLSPREASRIQTFPDDFIFMGANNNWYAQIGNAVPVILAEIIGNQLIKHLK